MLVSWERRTRGAALPVVEKTLQIRSSAGTAVRPFRRKHRPRPPPSRRPTTRTLRRRSVASSPASVADRLVETGGQLPEERRLVTALFADVSGFTSLADRLDPEELIEVIDPVITALSDIVGRYDGYVEKYAGDALLALFGAPGESRGRRREGSSRGARDA